jgi:hypothetical protein
MVRQIVDLGEDRPVADTALASMQNDQYGRSM